MSGIEALSATHDYLLHASTIKQRLIEEGSVVDDGVDPAMNLMEHGYFADAHIGMRAEKFGPKAIAGSQSTLAAEMNQLAVEGHYGIPAGFFGPGGHELYGPLAGNYHVWLAKIKAAFDPNGVSRLLGTLRLNASQQDTRVQRRDRLRAHTARRSF